MSAITSILRQVILLKFLQRNRDGVTLAQIGEYMAERFQIDADQYLQRTFQRDKDAISKNYHIEIDYALKTYRIINTPAVLALEALEVFQALNAVLDEEELNGAVIFETHQPKGARHFKALLRAIDKNLQVRFYYRPSPGDDPKRCLAEPYALKEFRGRWYLLAIDNHDLETKVFTLDKITWLETSGNEFTYPVFINPIIKFKNCFGITLPRPGDDIQHIILSFAPWQNDAIKNHPLHVSQTELADNENEYRISLDVYITVDLIMEILSCGESVKVIAPESLVEVVRERYEAGSQ